MRARCSGRGRRIREEREDRRARREEERAQRHGRPPKSSAILGVSPRVAPVRRDG